MECEKHEYNEILYVCVPCDYVLVCSKCLIESHNGHRMVSFDEAKADIQKRLQNHASENAHLVFDLVTQIQSLSEALKEQNKATDQINKCILERRRKLHELVDQFADQLTTESEIIRKKNHEIIHKQSLAITKQKAEAKLFGTQLKEILDNETVISMIQAFNELEPPTIQERTCQFPKTPQYVQKPANAEMILEYYGHLVNASSKDKTTANLSIHPC